MEDIENSCTIVRNVCKMLMRRGYVVMMKYIVADKKDVYEEVVTVIPPKPREEQKSKKKKKRKSTKKKGKSRKGKPESDSEDETFNLLTDADIISEIKTEYVRITELTFVHKEDNNRMVHVFFSWDDSIDKDGIKKYVGAVKAHYSSEYRGIIVYANKVTPMVNEVVRTMKEKTGHDRVVMELFDRDEFMIDNIAYTWQPRFALLNANEKAVLLAKYKIKDFALPRIFITDKMAMYYGAELSNVFKIVRRAEAGSYVTYRVVV